MKKLLYPLGLSVLAIMIWEFMLAGPIWPDYLLPKPSQIFVAYQESWGELLAGSFSTLTSALLGLGGAFIAGLFFALLFSLVPILYYSVMPFSVFFQTVPVIAVAPLLVIWFGFGEPTVRASAFIVCFFPILANALNGLKSVNQDYLELARVHGYSRVSQVLRIQFPFAVAQIFVGLKISGGLAVVGAIVGEFIAGGGLGSIIDSARSQQRVDLVFAAIILSAILGLIVVGLLEFIAQQIKKIRPYY